MEGQEEQEHPIELSEHCVEAYDILGFPKTSGRVHSVALHFENIQEWLELLHPYNAKCN